MDPRSYAASIHRLDKFNVDKTIYDYSYKYVGNDKPTSPNMWVYHSNWRTMVIRVTKILYLFMKIY